jgi:hypothetical protein
MQQSADRYPTPWRIADHDARIYIVAANGVRVTEVEPGQQHGHVPTKQERIAVAQRIINAANTADGVIARDGDGRSIPSQWLREQQEVAMQQQEAQRISEAPRTDYYGWWPFGEDGA